MSTIENQRQQIREENDRFRTTLEGGTVLMTQGIQATGLVEAILAEVQAFDAFTNDNDPYQEHDFGAFNYGGRRIYWKIDYYDNELLGFHPPNEPGCHRVMTVLLASEY